ncbi:MAG: protein translocase subunit SecF [bacterium]|nr:protein translocase subunit SecF [bacterium]
MRIIPYKRFWLTFSAVLTISSIAVYVLFGLRFSADFIEGTLISFKFLPPVETTTDAEGQDPSLEGGTDPVVLPVDITQDKLRSVLNSYQSSTTASSLGNMEIKESIDGTFILRFRRISAEEAESLLEFIRTKLGPFEILQSRDVSPLYAQAFRAKATIAILLAIVMIILYITYAFRRVSRGIKSWKLGLAAIIASVHDVLVTVGVFVVLGVLFKVEIDALFITALLSVLGYSVHDTIVVFDRLRDNLLTKHHAETFEQVAERSIQRTLARSVNTSFTTLLVLVPLLIFAASEIYFFIFALLIGIVVGTYSSIFLATPLLCVLEKYEKNH